VSMHVCMCMSVEPSLLLPLTGAPLKRQPSPQVAVETGTVQNIYFIFASAPNTGGIVYSYLAK